MSEPIRESIAVQGGAISCLEWKDRRRDTLLFVHANGFNAQTYRVLLAPLSDCLHVLACDLRGHGFSSLPAPAGLAKGWEVFARDLIALTARISNTSVLLAGHSLGATTSLMAAALAPGQIRALILVEPVLLPSLVAEAGEPVNTLALRAQARRGVFPSYEAARTTYRGRGIFAAWPDEVLDDYLAGGLIDDGDGNLRLACSPRWEAEIFRAPPRGIARIAEKISCPISILRGTVVSTATDGAIEQILHARPCTKVTTIEDANHFLPMEDPAPVREEIRRASAAAA